MRKESEGEDNKWPWPIVLVFVWKNRLKLERHYLAFSVTSPQDRMGHVSGDWHGRICWRRRVKDGWIAGNCFAVTSQWVIQDMRGWKKVKRIYCGDTATGRLWRSGEDLMWKRCNRPVVMVRWGFNVGTLQPAGCDGRWGFNVGTLQPAGCDGPVRV